MRHRLIIAIVVVLLLLAGLITFLWTALDWPPPRLILKYGLPPQGGPTGRTKVIAGLQFAELGRGYTRIEVTAYPGGGVVQNLMRLLGIGGPPNPLSPGTGGLWLESPEGFWIARLPYSSHPALETGGRRSREEWLNERAPGTVRRATDEEACIAIARGVLPEHGTWFCVGEIDGELLVITWGGCTTLMQSPWDLVWLPLEED